MNGHRFTYSLGVFNLNLQIIIITYLEKRNLFFICKNVAMIKLAVKPIIQTSLKTKE